MVKDKWDYLGKYVDGKYKGWEKRYVFNVYINFNLMEFFVMLLIWFFFVWDIFEEFWDFEDDIDESFVVVDVFLL